MERREFGDEMYAGKSFKGPKTKGPKKSSHALAPQKRDFGNRCFDAAATAATAADDSSSLNHHQFADGDALSHNGPAEADFLGLDKRVLFSLDFKSSKELHDLKTKLESELSSVRNLLKQIEHYSGTNLSVNDAARAGKLKRVHSEVGSVDASDPLNIPRRKDIQAATSKVGKGIREPKASKFHKSSDYSFVKDKIPPHSGQAKKSRVNGKSDMVDDSGSLFGMNNSSSKVFKSCTALLDKLMKQKNAWVFNSPVDVEGLGLHDYFTIIKNPMDLGTAKSRLSTNWYRTPEEFAEDVRLTFHNAMTYNLEGHEINTLAKQLLKMFEDKWTSIEADCLRQISTVADSVAELPNPAPTRAPPATPPLPPPVDMPMIVDRSESTTNPAGSEPKVSNSLASSRSRLPKPKARDPNKRDMTLHEKEKLSANLQELPPEKLDGVLRIIKKRNPSLCQNDDEIEVDIDSVDIETLWELDRFVIYYKKSLSKMKRSAESGQIGVKAEPSLLEKIEADFVPSAQENENDDKNISLSPSVERGNEGGNASVSGGSTSSSSDSGSSSSDSDTDSSSS